MCKGRSCFILQGWSSWCPKEAYRAPTVSCVEWELLSIGDDSLAVILLSPITSTVSRGPPRWDVKATSLPKLWFSPQHQAQIRQAGLRRIWAALSWCCLDQWRSFIFLSSHTPYIPPLFLTHNLIQDNVLVCIIGLLLLPVIYIASEMDIKNDKSI